MYVEVRKTYCGQNKRQRLLADEQRYEEHVCSSSRGGLPGPAVQDRQQVQIRPALASGRTVSGNCRWQIMGCISPGTFPPTMLL